MILTKTYQKIGAEVYRVVGNNELRLYAKYNSQNVVNNTTNVTFQLRTIATSGSFYSEENSSSLTCNGSRGVQYYDIGTVNTSSEKIIGTWTFDLSHSNNGTYSGSASASANVYYNVNPSVSASFDLPTIARKSTISVNNGNIGSNTSINISCADNSFTHTLTYSFSGLSGTIATKTATKPIFTWQIPSSFYAKLPNASSGTATVNCETFSGNTSLGTTSTTFTAYVTDSKPEFDTTITDSNSVANALTGDNTKFIKGYSNAYIQSLVTTKNSATRSSYSVSNGTQSSSTYPNTTIYAIQEKAFTFNTRDSRGDTPATSSEYPIYTIANDKWVEYFKPVITSILIERTEQTSTEVEANISGSFFNSSFGSVSNTLKYAWRKKESSSETWETWSSLTTPTISGNSFNITNLSLGNSYATDKSYDFQFKFVDELGSRDSTQIVIPIVQTVTVSIPIVEIGEDYVATSGTFYMLVNDTLVPILEIVDE